MWTCGDPSCGDDGLSIRRAPRTFGTISAPIRHRVPQTRHTDSWSVSGMSPTAQHRTVESRFRTLIAAADLDPPDRVEYGACGVVFFWDGPQVAVSVDFDDPVTDLPVRPPRSRIPRRPA
jgi:hypothetical protein